MIQLIFYTIMTMYPKNKSIETWMILALQMD